jgi:MerR family transcriptional regulator, light-induced transcriptional regulator
MDAYKIDHVAKLTGLSKHVIRSWERRFDLLNPIRGGNRYRMYTEQDIELLSYIRKELENGFAIGELAKLGRENLIDQMTDKKELINKGLVAPSVRINEILIESLRPFDKNKFIRGLNEAVSLLSFDEVCVKVFIPLQRKVGDLWHEGEIGVGEEHFVSNYIRQKFLSVLNQMPALDDGPKVVISCLPNDYHELGATIAAYQCAINRCQVFYLGANMPVQGLAEFCSYTRPNLVLLSCNKEMDASEAKSLADEYAKFLLPICPIWAGGPSLKESLGKYFIENKVDVLESLSELETKLKNLPHYLRQINKEQ